MSSLPSTQPQQPPPRRPLNIQRRPSTRTRDTNPPKPPSRSSSFSFSNRTSFSSIDSAIHTHHRDPTSKSKSRSNSSGGGGIHNPVPTTTTTAATSTLPPEQQQSFTCTFCWRLYPSSDRHMFHRSSTSNGRGTGSWKKEAPRPACPPCYRAIIDLSIYWVCGEVVVRGEECVSLGWCFWHRACYGCLLCGNKRVVRPPGVGVGVGEGFGDARTGENNDGKKGGRELEMLGRKRGREIDQVPLCKGCLVEVEGKGLGLGDEEEREKVVVKKGLERIDRVDGGLTRRRWEMKEGEKEKEKEEKKIGDGGKGGLLPLRRGAVDDRSLTKDEMASSPGSDKPETIYVNIFDPVGREAFRPSLMKSIPEWMQSGAREHLDREAGSSLPVNLDHQKLREQMADRASTISTPRPISQGLSETSSTATVIQTPPQPTASRAASTRRRSGAISPRATSPTPSIDAISRASSVRTGTSFVSEQPLVVPSMSSNHPKETTKGPAKDTRDSWLSTDSNVSSNPNTSSYNNNQPETLSRPSAVRSVATIFERGIASKDQRHTPVNQPLPLLRILQQPYRPLTPTRSDTSLSSSSPHLQPNNLATRPQRAQTHELGAASLPKPIQILRSGQAGKQSQINRMGSATVSIPVVSTSSEYLERYQPVKASTIFLSSSSPAQGARSSVRSIRAGGPGVSAITRGWEGQLSNTSSSGETERGDLAKRLPVYSTSQPPSSFVQSSYTKEGQTTSIRRSVSHSIRQEGALDEGQVRMGQSSPSETYTNGQGQITIRRSISHSLRREGAHDQGQSHHFTSQPQSPKPQSPTLPSRRLPYSSSPNSPPNGPNGPTAPIPLNFTVQKRFVKRNNSTKGGPTIGGSVVTASSITGTEGAASTSSESSPGMGTGTGTGTGEEKGGGGGGGGGGSGLSRGNNWTRTRTPSAAGNATTSGTGTGSTPVMFGVVPVKTLSKRRSGVHAELKRLFGRQ